MSISMLQKSPIAVMRALVMIFSASISSGIFSDDWKYAIVTPVYKRGDVYDPNNYRLIALLPTISKLFEKLINEQLQDYLVANNTLNESQHGFRHGRSCQTALLRLSKILFTLKNAKKSICITTLDYSRAFDTINFDIMYSRLSHFTNSTL